MSDLFLGIDTSNYRTSVAVIDEKGEILFNHRELLEVPQGERGLRQSVAFFNHVQRLPEVMEKAMAYRDRIRAVAVSDRPRPREGSYMPCFTAGSSCAREVASALGVPLYMTSHQEGHIEAVRYYSDLRSEEDVIFFHFSGGTTEAVFRNEIVGGTLDIALGQVLDRVGVRLGLAFPSGEIMDAIALRTAEASSGLKPIKVKDCYMNLSGIETQSMRKAEELMGAGEPADMLIKELFDKLGRSILDMTMQLIDKYGNRPVIFAGGVSSSEYIRKYLSGELPDDVRYVFGEPELSGDNAVGVALIGMRSCLTR
ncbi:MAG: O-sialoglycoprotein endopeptidase [Firmicutes bacterium]|nr:O-sialoglycoprotein endopeptidase [Bacillota bacterium]